MPYLLLPLGCERAPLISVALVGAAGLDLGVLDAACLLGVMFLPRGCRHPAIIVVTVIRHSRMRNDGDGDGDRHRRFASYYHDLCIQSC